MVDALGPHLAVLLLRNLPIVYFFNVSFVVSFTRTVLTTGEKESRYIPFGVPLKVVTK